MFRTPNHRLPMYANPPPRTKSFRELLLSRKMFNGFTSAKAFEGYWSSLEVFKRFS
jgi:hypothetical protein